MASYTTIQGDTWDAIAYRLWGREHLMDLLLAANPEHADVILFRAGVVLAVPEIDLSGQIGPVTELPPWMK